MRYSGSCLCGQVTFTCDSDPVLQFNCHCRDCQKSTGAAYVPVMFFKREELIVSGELTYFESRGGSGRRIKRGFCKSCGAQMIGDVEIAAPFLAVRAGTLNDPTLYRPTADVYISQAAPWDCMNPDLAKFAAMPPRKVG